MKLDDIDLLLLRELQDDADRTNVDLARIVGLSPAGTLNRVRRLKETGVVRRITARLDPAQAGFPLQVYVSVTLARHDPRANRSFEETVRDYLGQELANHDEAQRKEIMDLAEELMKEVQA